MNGRLTEYKDYISDKAEYERHLSQGYPRNIGRERFLKLAEYENLEEQGKLIKLPCNIGDTVYVKMASYCNVLYAEAKVRDFTHFTSHGFCVVVTSNYFDKQNIPFTEFGKTVFLTKEAEKKLEELDNGRT